MDLKEVIDGKRKLGKFDVIVGNPPYQKAKNKQNPDVSGMCGGIFWDKFMVKSIELCIQNGYIVLVHPGQWRKPEHKLLELVKKYNLIFLSIHNLTDGQKTFGAATGYDWYVLQKADYDGQTIIKGSDNQYSTINVLEWQFIPNCELNRIQKILSDKRKIIFSHSSYETRKDYISMGKNQEFKYPCVYGLTQKDGLKLYWSKTQSNGHFGVPKVIIPLSKYTDAFVDDKGEYGICQFAFGIPIDSKEEGEQIKQVIMSEEFAPIWDAFEWIYNSKEWRVFKYLKKDFWKQFLDDVEE